MIYLCSAGHIYPSSRYKNEHLLLQNPTEKDIKLRAHNKFDARIVLAEFLFKFSSSGATRLEVKKQMVV